MTNSVTTEWTKDELLRDYDVLGFAYGLCVVRRKVDGVRGTLSFKPVDRDGGLTRIYYDFQMEAQPW